MNQEDYDRKERAFTRLSIRQLDSQGLLDRKEAREDYARAATTDAGLSIIGRTVEWILEGHYGHGAYLLGWDIVDNKRIDRASAMGKLVAALEYQCPPREAQKIYRNLATDEKLDLYKTILSKIYLAVEQEG